MLAFSYFESNTKVQANGHKNHSIQNIIARNPVTELL